MNTWIIKNILFPAQEKIMGRRTLACLDELEKTQLYTHQQLQDFQFQKLKVFLRQAYKNVPYYKKLFDKVGFSVDNLRDLPDFQKIPMLTKKEIRDNPQEFMAANIKDLTQWTTGGSTGEPLIFYVDNLRMSYNAAAKIRSRRWWGIDIGDRELCFWGSPIDVTARTRVKQLRDKLMNIYVLSAYNMTPDSLRHYVRELKRIRPKHIFGYGTGIYYFAKFILENDLNVKDCGIKAIFSTAEKLIDKHRAVISEAFGCPVADGYGGRETGFIAHECPQGNMHISADKAYVEVIRDGKPADDGEEGEIVITNFNSYGMPFIRYRTDDIGVISYEKCACGVTLPILKKILGRTQDSVFTRGGKIIHWVFFMKLIEGMQGVERFQVVQKSLDKISVDIVKNDSFDNARIQTIQQEIKKRMGEETEVLVNFRESIPLSKSGKFKWIISELKDQEPIGVK